MDTTESQAVKPRGGWLRRFAWRDEWYPVLAIQLIVLTLLLRLLWLNQPAGALIFDETYYVNAARVMLALPMPEGATYGEATPGLDPNREHLPFAKLIIAGSMRVFGDNAFGWRIPSVLFGTGCVVLLYLIVKRMTRRPAIALLASFAFSFDNLIFVHGRIATLDIFMLFFMLLGVYSYVIRRPEVAGAAFALSTMSKFNGVFVIPAILGFELLRYFLNPEARARGWRAAADVLIMLGSGIIVFLALLWPIDRHWTSYDNPVDHVAYVYDYGMALRRAGPPQGIESAPWQWLMNEVQIPYFSQDNNVTVDDKIVSTYSIVRFLGAMNPFVIFLFLPIIAYFLRSLFRRRDDFSLLMLTMVAVFYLQPLLTSVLFQRISYLFYFMPVLPALCAGIGYFFVDLKLPRSVVFGYVASILFGFAMLFPYRALP